MKISVKNLPKSQIESMVELSSDEFERFEEKAIENLAKDLKMEGFRPGKVPKDIAKEKIGKNNVLTESADLAIKASYKKLISENNIEPASHPDIEVIKLASGNPFIFKVKISVIPKIELPDYKKIALRIKKKKVLVEDSEVKDSLKWLQKSRAKLSLKNVPAKKGDFVKIKYWSPQIKEINKPEGQEDAFILGEGKITPGFEDGLIGMKAGETKEITLDIPQNNLLRQSAGEKVVFKIEMKGVYDMSFPEINDEFAKGLGRFESLEKLENNIKEGILSEKEKAEEQRAIGELLKMIAENLILEIPDVLKEKEKSRMLERLKEKILRDFRIDFKDYLVRINETEEDLLDSFSSQAEEQIKRILILREIRKEENIEASEEETEQRINLILKHYSDTDQVKGLDIEELKLYTKEEIMNEKVLQKLGEIIK